MEYPNLTLPHKITEKPRQNLYHKIRKKAMLKFIW